MRLHISDTTSGELHSCLSQEEKAPKPLVNWALNQPSLIGSCVKNFIIEYFLSGGNHMEKFEHLAVGLWIPNQVQ